MVVFRPGLQFACKPEARPYAEIFGSGHAGGRLRIFLPPRGVTRQRAFWCSRRPGAPIS